MLLNISKVAELGSDSKSSIQNRFRHPQAWMGTELMWSMPVLCFTVNLDLLVYFLSLPPYDDLGWVPRSWMRRLRP